MPLQSRFRVNMITNKNEAKAMRDHISCDCKCKFNSTICIPNQIMESKKIIVGILTHVFVRRKIREKYC